ncbi:AMP-dependent synthetase and ligase family protein [Actinidia rufa]|uniref:AMP-dependent synthetase and ligase family protein n=1 Tax=Actinidia rufa TaxID=165716 RepID=A0A7J0GF56_9ERIC|nr:AMP-dependent synthetase and ligase family protein [Actinidia rufa]
MEGLLQSPANYVPLSPISFLERAAFVYGDQVSLVYGNKTYLWRETHQRCLKLASALSQMGVTRGDVVAALAPNIPELYELYFGVPMAGAVISALNTRHDAPMLGLLLSQLEAKIICVHHQFVEITLKALEVLSKPPLLIVMTESDQTPHQLPQNSLSYEGLVAMGKHDFEIVRPKDECDPISVNFTSGSTGTPKGAVYSHRATYLNSLGVILRYDMRAMPVFLWTVDIFRCSGWCFTWAMAALGGANIFIGNVTAEAIFDAICLHKVTYLCGAPTILNRIAETCSANFPPLPHKVEIIVAGALPPLQILNKVQEMGFIVSHSYGMTEALGPVIMKSLMHELDDDREKIRCREKIHNMMMEGVDVKDPTTMTSVPFDGKTVGEIMFRSNTLMSGDLGVRDTDGYIHIKDRAVDLILSSGGETISTIEVEAVLASHPAIEAAAVVGRPNDDLGDVPCAFVKLKEGCRASAQEIVEFCEDKLAHYMVPRSVDFGDLPTSSTGKIQKFVLRERDKAMGSLSHSNGH